MDFERLMAAEAVDFVQPSPAKMGVVSISKRNSMAACSHHSEVASRSHKALAWESIPTRASFAPT